MTIITYGTSVKENAKSRRHARRRAVAIERDALNAIIDAALNVEPILEAAEARKPVDRVCKALSCTDYKMNLRVKPVPEALTRENPEYRKVKNPLGQITNARQKMRGKSIPLI